MLIHSGKLMLFKGILHFVNDIMVGRTTTSLRILTNRRNFSYSCRMKLSSIFLPFGVYFDGYLNDVGFDVS